MTDLHGLRADNTPLPTGPGTNLTRELRDNNAMNRSRENLVVTISADWHSPIISAATIYLRVARRGSIIADVIPLGLIGTSGCIKRLIER